MPDEDNDKLDQMAPQTAPTKPLSVPKTRSHFPTVDEVVAIASFGFRLETLELIEAFLKEEGIHPFISGSIIQGVEVYKEDADKARELLRTWAKKDKIPLHILEKDGKVTDPQAERPRELRWPWVGKGIYDNAFVQQDHHGTCCSWVYLRSDEVVTKVKPVTRQSSRKSK